MARIGIVGFGFMGRMHYNHYLTIENAEVVAICDADAKRLAEDSKVAGNVAGAEEPLDLSKVDLYTDFDEMLETTPLDAVSITLPTFLHADFTCRALAKGVHVLCEKPMALIPAECERMIAASKESGKVLQVGHCIRFWPEYVKAKELVDSGEYGKLLAAAFRRLSAPPTWSSDNWLGNTERSGGMVLDLHIHDTDFVQHLLGMPKAVYSKGAKDPHGVVGHVMTHYLYANDVAILAEGGWLMKPAFGFEMSFNMILEGATILFDCTRSPAFRVCPAEGEAFTPEVAAGDGYERQIRHFLRAIAGESVPPVATMESSRDSIKIVEAEVASLNSGAIARVG